MITESAECDNRREDKHHCDADHDKPLQVDNRRFSDTEQLERLMDDVRDKPRAGIRVEPEQARNVKASGGLVDKLDQRCSRIEKTSKNNRTL